MIFDIIHLLTEDQSYGLAMEALREGILDVDRTQTVINFSLIQADGSQLLTKYEITGSDLFLILRANADRCSALKELNHENGCIGSGSPDDVVRETVLGDRLGR